jgi:hypothetical protein
MAFPSFMSTCTPANVASGWLDATIPFLAITENFSAMTTPFSIYSNKIQRSKLALSLILNFEPGTLNCVWRV